MNEFPLIGQPTPLLIKHLLDRPLAWAPNQKIIYRNLVALTYTQFYQRVQRLANVLTSLGVRPGDKVGVLDWDSHRYLELFFALPMVGAVLHTVNVRLSPEQTHFTIHHAEDCVLFVFSEFVDLIAGLLPRLPAVKHLVLLSDGGKAPPSTLSFAGEYEALLQTSAPQFEFPEFDENRIATMMYTTGTTGDPKGVFFSHRQIVLHTLAIGFAITAFRNPLVLSEQDTYLPLTPMFHVHAWGIPYLATLMGLKQVYPGRYEPQMLRQLVCGQGGVFTHCVPTMLQMLLHHPAFAGADLSRLKILIGGAALAKGLAQEAMQRGIQIMGGYGSSETCPVVAISQMRPQAEDLKEADAIEFITRTGFPVPLARVRTVDSAGLPLPPGKEHVGEVVVQAPWLTQGYYKEEEKSRHLWRSGWLHMGDIGYMDELGYIRITDRLKDVIKIGGEWISSLELENVLSQHPAVKEAAVVGIPDAKWDERPYAEVVLREEHRGKVTGKELLNFLREFMERGVIHKRAILTEICIVEAIPKTGVGKLDKKAMRAHYAAQ